MTALALGWCAAPVDLPSELLSFKAQDLIVVAAAAHLVASPRKRMRAQLACYDNGIDLVPTAPDIPLTLTEATKFACDQAVALRDTLRNNAGHCQLTLRGTAKTHDDITVSPAESWLRTRTRLRQSRQQQRDQLENFLLRMCDGLGVCSPISHSADGKSASFHLRLSRRDVASAKQQITERVKHDAGPVDSLCVTGPWPTYAFTSFGVDTTKQISA